MATNPEHSPTRRRSRIAGANAWFRAQESGRPPSERILEDAWARGLAEGARPLALLRALGRVVPRLGETMRDLVTAHCVRHRAVDQLVVAALATGVRQVVVIGAGYDMRAARLGGPNHLRWFEIDDPATQARKGERLARLAAHDRGRAAVVRVSADLEREPLAAILDRAGFDPALATCFVVEGLVHYLSAVAFESLLRGMGRCRAQVHLVLTFIEQGMPARAGATLRAFFRAAGERPQLFWSSAALVERLGAHGFAGARCWDFAQQRDAFIPVEVRDSRPLAARWWQVVLAVTRAPMHATVGATASDLPQGKPTT